MELELMNQERMGVEGRGILRSLQNDTLPLVDLLIRESIQNSLDAGKKDAKSIDVNIGVNKFKVSMLADKLEGITEILKEKYPGTSKAIYISDKNTVGLTGDVRKKEGNIYSLIYTIQKNQEQAGAGGSWGLGKTSFFRVGNGIVLYYSRVKLKNGLYEERLAGSLIEDSTKKDRLIDNNRGIAWWGERDIKGTKNPTYPITNTKKIHSILKIFNIDPYIDDETGTTVIIPFIDEKRMLPKNEDEKKEEYIWEKNIEEAIEMAIQKWYAPRIFNDMYEGAYLIARINGDPLMPDEFRPFFKEVRNIYIQGLEKKNKGNIKVDEIKMKRRGVSSHNGVAGWFAHGKYDKVDLDMIAPNNEIHPLEYFGGNNIDELEKTNARIIAYARKPGMIIEYDINSDWSKNLVPLEDKFIMGFFIPNSKALLYEQFREPKINTLEDYLRKTEKSDHAEWEDVTLNNIKITIVNRLRRNVSRALIRTYNESEDEKHMSKTSVLGRKVGDKLLPEHGVSGRRSTGPKKTIRKPSKKRGKRSVSINLLSVESISYDELAVCFSLTLLAKIKANISIDIRTENKNLTENKWKRDIGEDIKYPFEIKKVYINEVANKKVNIDNESLKNKKVLSFPKRTENKSQVMIKNELKNNELNILGKLIIKVNDTVIQPSLAVKEVK